MSMQEVMHTHLQMAPEQEYLNTVILYIVGEYFKYEVKAAVFQFLFCWNLLPPSSSYFIKLR